MAPTPPPHTHAPQTPPERRHSTVLMLSAGARLLLALALVAGVWAAIAWAWGDA